MLHFPAPHRLHFSLLSPPPSPSPLSAASIPCSSSRTDAAAGGFEGSAVLFLHEQGRGLECAVPPRAQAAATERGAAGWRAIPKQLTADMANCYVFKSLLQEYAQKVGFSTPVYQTEKEGPSHEPVFKSTVIVNDVKYESLPGFLNRKAAEQSAAEVALVRLQQSGETTVNIPTVHETGLCKNLLQEYAQKMNYAIPSYICQKHSSGPNYFTCTVDIGGIQYIGAGAKTKKEAEIKAARTALLAIQQTATNGGSQYTVLPGKRKAKEQETQSKSVQELKPKKASFKKKKWAKKFRRTKDDLAAAPDTVELPNRAIEGEDMSVVQGNNVEMSGRREDEPLDRVNETKPNGCFQDQEQNDLTAMNAERSNEPHERKLADIAMLQQEVMKPVDLGSMSCLAG